MTDSFFLISWQRAWVFVDRMSERAAGLVAAVLVGATGLALAWWFTSRQLAMVASGLAAAYPLRYRFYAVGEVFGVFLASYLLSLLILSLIGPRVGKGYRALRVALAWLPALAAPAGAGLGIGLALVGIALVAVAVLTPPRSGWRALVGALAPHVAMLAVVAVVVTATATIVSPFGQADPLIVYKIPSQGDLHVLAPIYRGYVWAKQFSFSDLDYSAWAAAPDVSTNLESVPAKFLALALDLPSIDVKSFHRLVTGLTYVVFIAGTFGFYLLLALGLRVRYGVALLGSLLFILGNVPFQDSFQGDYLFFVSSYALLPYALLALNLTIRLNSLVGALWTGAALAMPFYILAPHPEAAMHAVFVFGCIALFWLLPWSEGPGIERRLMLMGAVAGTAFALSAAHLFPIIAVALSGDEITFGHLSGIFGPSPPTGQLQAFYPYGRVGALLAVPALAAQWHRRRLAPELWGLGLVSAIVLGILIPYGRGPLADLVRWSGLPIYFINPQRIISYLFFAVLVSAALGADALLDGMEALVRRAFAWQARSRPSHSVGERNVVMILLFAAYALGAYGVYAADDPRGELKTGRLIDNPKGCSYYISLRANLADIRGLAEDHANFAFLRGRLSQFEQDATVPGTPAAARAQAYYAVLGAFGVLSARSLTDAQVVPAIRATWRIVDGAYLDEKGCIYQPMIMGDNENGFWGTAPKPRGIKSILRFNNDALYADLPGRFLRILGATGRTREPLQPPRPFEIPLAGEAPRAVDSHLGLGAGLFINNATTAFDSRFMMGYPLLQALYLYPNYYFERRGTYQDLMYWKLDAREVLAPTARKVLDIAGIDIITVRNENLKDDIDFSGLVRLAVEMPAVVDPRYTVLLNTHSYGMAYVADGIHTVDPGTVGQKAAMIRDYFRRRLAPEVYRSLVSGLRDELLALEGRHEILLETTMPQLFTPAAVKSDRDAGTATIEGIVGPRALIDVQCDRPACVVVFNHAAFSGWRVFSDGAPSPKYRANYAFLATTVGPGRHQVVFLYMPLSARMGTVLTLLALNLMLWWSRKTGDKVGASLRRDL